MKSHLLAAVALVPFLALPVVAETSTVSAALAVAPPIVLPGLPSSFLVTIKNMSNQPLRLFEGVVVNISSAAGTFEAQGVNDRTQFALPESQMDKCGTSLCFAVPALGTRQLYIDFGPGLTGNEAFFDRRLCQAGSYDVHLTLRGDTADGSPVTVETIPASLTIQSPQGVDADAFHWLLTQSGGTAWTALNWAMGGDAVASELRTRFPDSQYSLWTAALGGTSREGQLSSLDRALATNPAPGLRDMLLWAKGSLLAQWNSTAIYIDRDIQRAVAYADAATSTLNTLRDVAIAGVLSQRAADTIKGLYTSKSGDATLRQLEASDSPAPAAVVPRVECVAPGLGQSFTARFSYTNPNTAMKVIPLGNSNQITPAPRDQGQPRVFKTGDHANAFTAKSPGGNLIWHLDGNKASASAEFPMQCEPGRPR
jgi:hypothetical protein